MEYRDAEQRQPEQDEIDRNPEQLDRLDQRGTGGDIPGRDGGQDKHRSRSSQGRDKDHGSLPLASVSGRWSRWASDLFCAAHENPVMQDSLMELMMQDPLMQDQ